MGLRPLETSKRYRIIYLITTRFYTYNPTETLHKPGNGGRMAIADERAIRAALAVTTGPAAARSVHIARYRSTTQYAVG